MEILVCIKQVPDDSVTVHLKANTGEADLDGISPVVNAFDTYALEMAVRLKESSGGAVTVISVGPEGTENAIKSCLAVGADRGYLINDAAFNNADAPEKSKILASSVKYLEKSTGKHFDIIFCGKEATDYSYGQVGPQLAEIMEIGVVTDLTDIKKTDAGVCCKQETEDGYRTVQTGLPCVVTVSKPAYDPRYPTIRSKLAARKMEIPVLTSSQIGNIAAVKTANITLRVYEPPKRKCGVKIKEKTCAGSACKAVGMLADAKLL
jgi:electron transfer flavoprotein beta subunit